ncbi:cation channel sperm-associated auxiliary subunit beta [Ctenodactylus gundi]
MGSLLIYVIILLLNMFEFSSGIVYNKGDMESHFTCSSYGFPQKSEIIKLFLSSKNLKVRCFFQVENKPASLKMINIFTSGGLAPCFGIINSTYYSIFHFNLTLFSDRVFWLIDIPRENITRNTDVAAVEEWLVRVTLHHGLNIYATEGTLLDTVREPILQWVLGPQITDQKVSELQPHVIDLVITKSPCANDVALLGYVLNTTRNGVYMSVTFSGFWHKGEMFWYDLTNIVSSQLQQEHKGLTVLDMVLTNHFLVILTSLGLYVSGDLRYPSVPELELSRADFCGFERVDYLKGKLWYNERCFANREKFEVDYVTITFDRNGTLSEASSCFYSEEPFLNWLPCLPLLFHGVKTTFPRVITFLVDQENDNGIYLFYDRSKKTTTVSVNNIAENRELSGTPKFPVFYFPPSFSSPVGMVFHPRSHFLYAYGNQVWLSMDGGNTFELIAHFHGDIIKKTYHSFYSSDIIFLSQNGKVYLTKAGLGTYNEIGIITDKVFTLYYDHLGFIHKLTPYKSEVDGTLRTFGNTKRMFGQPPDMGLKTALAPQHTSFKEMIFFAYVPANESQKTVYTKKFSNIHPGKVIHSSKTGRAYIRKVLQHKTPEGFLSSVIAELIDPFGTEDVNESPCLSSSLLVQEHTSSSYKLTLDSQNANALFKATDIEKTVVIPGYSSFLIIAIEDDKNALGIATMPKIAPVNITFATNSWFLYNFGQSNRRTWHVYPKPCNYWFQQHDDSLSLNPVKYIDLGNTQNLQVKIIPNTKGTETFEVPPLRVLVGNTKLLKVAVEGSFDHTNNYLMEISATSEAFSQGFTSLAFILWDASTECFLTTLLPTLKSSCSYLRSLKQVHSYHFRDRSSGVRRDRHSFNPFKTLPVNYRPPSNMGIAVPLTDNFYHADPSKPVPRNLFHRAKGTGKYKQCAGASTREECHCTSDQKFSYNVEFSDCKEQVPHFQFPLKQYPIVLEISSENQFIPLKSPYLVTVTEVNKRQNWRLKHTVPENVEKMKNFLEPILHTSVYNPSDLNLSIQGSELFHFRVSVVPGVTFCNLVEEFQVQPHKFLSEHRRLENISSGYGLQKGKQLNFKSLPALSLGAAAQKTKTVPCRQIRHASASPRHLPGGLLRRPHSPNPAPPQLPPSSSRRRSGGSEPRALSRESGGDAEAAGRAEPGADATPLPSPERGR